MWKLLAVTVLFGLCYADLTHWNADGTEFHLNNKHYSQHEQSVNAARKGASERLAKMGSSSAYVNQIQPGYSSTVPCCGAAELSSSRFTGNSDAESIGHGVVGFSSGLESNSKYSSSASDRQENYQTLPAQIYPASSRSSYSSASQRESAIATKPIATYPIASGASIGSESSRYAASGRQEKIQRMPIAIYPAGGSERYSNRAESFSERRSGAPLITNDHIAQDGHVSTSEMRTIPVQVYSPRYSSQSRYSDRDVDSAVYAPVRAVYAVHAPVIDSAQYTRHESAQSQTQESQPLYDSSSRLSEQDNPSRGQVTYIPVRFSVQPTSSKYAGRQDAYSRSGNNYIQTVPAESQSSLSSKHSTQEQRVTESGTYVPVPIGTKTSSSKYAASAHDQRLQSGQYIPSSNMRPGVHYPLGPDNRSPSVGSYSTIPNANVGSSTKYSSSAHDERLSETGSYVPVPVVSTGSSSSHQSAHEQRSSQGGSYIPVPAVSSASSSKYSASEQEQRLSETNAYVPVASRGGVSQYSSRANEKQSRDYAQYPISNDRLGARFGASGDLGAGNELSGFMSESERLAKLQSQNVYNANTPLRGSATIDDSFGNSGSSQGLNSLGTDNAGFQRTKSWSSSSKWAAGQQYGADGKPKTYSMLSTAESEKHNINGAETGYKAATTTLEDDGKVSTYSIHTP